MNIFQAYLTITKNISHYLPHQKNAYRKTAILAAIALSYTTPKKISDAIYIDQERVKKIAKQLILEKLITCELLSTWPYQNKYSLTAKGEKMTINLLNYKTKPQLSNHE